jgi:proprotein convertase subtilisin/kexin type 2
MIDPAGSRAFPSRARRRPPSMSSFLAVLAGALLAACGGGGGGGSDAPAKPQNLIATLVGPDIALAWDASPGAASYRVYFAQTAGVVAKSTALLGTTAATSVQISGFPAGFELFFAVAAVRDGDASGLSNVASATVPPTPGVDPLLLDQWHLDNTGQAGGTPGEDANLVDAWNAGFRGQGVRIAVVDDGLEIFHEDLAGNVVGGKSHSYVGPDPLDPTRGEHGTACAGVAAAVGDNSLGVRGAAWEAELVGYDLLQEFTGVNRVDAMTRNAAEIWVSSNSWGPPDGDGIPQGSDAAWRDAVAQGVTTGRGGQGIVYLWACGNGADAAGNPTDNSNLDGFANFWGVIAVGAVGDDGIKASYSEEGANVMVCAPSMGRANHGISTVDRSGGDGYNAGAPPDYADPGYTNTFNGTSSSTPLAAGVVALMLQANPALTWRDVRVLLAQTARVNDPTDVDWTQNGAGYFINHKYGFGVVDAGAAVAAAQAWTNVGPQVQLVTPVSAPDLLIPDADPNGVSDAIVVAGSGIAQIEFVRVRFDSNHPATGDLEIVLQAPSGTLSVLAEAHNQPSGSAPYDDFTFGSVRHLDEPADGTWTLVVRDLLAADTGRLRSWRLEIHGR